MSGNARRWPLFVLLPLAAVLCSVGIPRLLPARYAATAALRVTSVGSGSSLQPSVLARNDLAAQTAQLGTATPVIGLAAGRLERGSTVSAFRVANQNIVDVRVVAGRPASAVTGATAVAAALVDYLDGIRKQGEADARRTAELAWAPLDDRIAALQVQLARSGGGPATRVADDRRRVLIDQLAGQRRDLGRALTVAQAATPTVPFAAIGEPTGAANQAPGPLDTAAAGLLVGLAGATALRLTPRSRRFAAGGPSLRTAAGRLAGSPLAVLAAVLTLAAVAGSASVTSRLLFDDTGTLKYILTVAAPLALLALVVVPDPLLAVTGAALVVAPFALVFSAAGVNLTPLTAVLVAGLPIALARERPGPAGRRSALGVGALVLVGLLAVPMIIGAKGGTYAALLATVLAVGWLVAKVGADPAARRVLMGTFALSVAAQGALAVVEFRTGHQLNLYGVSDSSTFSTDYFFGYAGVNRPAAAFPDPIALGNVLALGCCVALAATLGARGAGVRLAMAACVIVSAAGVIVTFSRMSWVAAAVGMVVVLLLSPLRQAVAGALGIAAGAALLLSLALAFNGPQLRERFASLTNPVSSSNATADTDRTRVQLWTAAYDVGRHHPVFGVGLGGLAPELSAHLPGTDSGTHAHDTYLQFFAEGGLAGVLGLGVVVLAAGRDLVVARRRNRLQVAGLAGALCALLIVWTTDVTIRQPGVAVLVAAVFGLIAAVRREQSAGAVPRAAPAPARAPAPVPASGPRRLTALPADHPWAAALPC